MRRYVTRRLAQAVGVLWAAYTVSFFVLYYLPGDPVAAMFGGGLDSTTVSPAQIAELRHRYGFDKPVFVQYIDYLGKAVRGDFGNSVSTGRSVTATLAGALPQTFALAGLALLLSVVIGGALAVSASYTRRRWLRQVLLSLPSLGMSLPTFWVGLMLIELLSFRIGLFPAFGDGGLRGLVLPAVTLAVPPGALVAQVLAKSLLAALDEPYVQTAQSKGASRLRIHLRHTLRNASLPTLTVVGLIGGQLLANAVVVETVFSREGMGRVTANAVTTQDIPLVQGVVVFGALVFVLLNLIIDLTYPLLDPRIIATPGSRGAIAGVGA
ncbi:ABC transporter permease [Frankia sp. QA3]|uniref:ABC transporter permease n=1 Tax=Frankia sp. QA3 TaxID=710111 RepID=UPI00055FE0A5|nr:ABC transporter permease [Frankia sp. QA3]